MRLRTTSFERRLIKSPLRSYINPPAKSQSDGGTKMRRNYTRQQVIRAQIQIEALQEAVMIWLPVGFAFFELILHIFPKITWPILWNHFG